MASIDQRKSATGEVTYRVRVRLRGRPTESASFIRLTDARRWAQSTEAAIREGRHFKTSEAKRHTLADLIDRYVREVIPTKSKNGKNTSQHLAWWRKRLGAYALADVTASLIVEARNALLSTPTRRKKLPAPATVVRYLASLSHAFTIAVNEWEWLGDSPMRKVKKPVEARGRERFLSDVERERLLAACRASTSRYLYAVVVLAISTGMRRGEIHHLRWPQVDLHRRRILLVETKNNTSRSVPLHGLALELLTDLSKIRHIGGTAAFASDEGAPVSVAKPWATALRKAKIQNFRFHDLRHTAASYMAMNGATTIDIAAILGHKTLQMVQRYSHLADSHSATVVASMNEKVFGSHQ